MIAKDTVLFYCLVLLKLGVQFRFCKFEHDDLNLYFMKQDSCCCNLLLAGSIFMVELLLTKVP